MEQDFHKNVLTNNKKYVIINISKGKKVNIMKAKDVINVIEELSYSQGFYGRLLRDIKGLNAEDFREFCRVMEEQNFRDSLDVVLFFEC